MDISHEIEELILSILQDMKKLFDPNTGINRLREDINYKTEKLYVIVEALRLLKCDIPNQELLNTLKSIDGALKRIEQQVIPKKRSGKDYECPFQ